MSLKKMLTQVKVEDMEMNSDLVNIKQFHAHLYFDDEKISLVKELCKLISIYPKLKEIVTIGRLHQKPIGPHPIGSCQLSFLPQHLGEVMTFLALHRKDLDVFIHPVINDDRMDHVDYAIWMGKVYPLNLAVFNKHS